MRFKEYNTIQNIPNFPPTLLFFKDFEEKPSPAYKFFLSTIKHGRV